jgi:alkanesulfonate monooxygenase SsuD/methylene tetrahydromethanopterin reductase-like flavin-dependent oxidoreductase (luciferase family)
VLEQVALAEEAGFSNFWSVEHHFQPGFSHCSAPEVLYGALSQRTSKIRIGLRSCCCRSLTTIPCALQNESRHSIS